MSLPRDLRCDTLLRLDIFFLLDLRLILNYLDFIIRSLWVHKNVSSTLHGYLFLLLGMRVSNPTALLSKENSIFTLINSCFCGCFNVNSKNPFSVNSKLLNSQLDFFVNVSGDSIINSFDVVKFLLKSFKELSVFVV
jgi:hypothetical protein